MWLLFSNGNVGNNSEVTLSVTDYPPGDYNITFNYTDIYGQTAHVLERASLSGT